MPVSNAVTPEDAADVRRALDKHYARHPEVKPTLAEGALAAAAMDGDPLAARPDLVERAAAGVAAAAPTADCDDVLAYARELALRETKS